MRKHVCALLLESFAVFSSMYVASGNLVRNKVRGLQSTTLFTHMISGKMLKTKTDK